MDDMVLRAMIFLGAMLTLGIFAAGFGVDSRPDFDDPRSPRGGLDF